MTERPSWLHTQTDFHQSLSRSPRAQKVRKNRLVKLGYEPKQRLHHKMLVTHPHLLSIRISTPSAPGNYPQAAQKGCPEAPHRSVVLATVALPKRTGKEEATPRQTTEEAKN